MITIGETFFFSNQQHSNVSNKAAKPGINESKLACNEVVLIWLRPAPPNVLYCSKAASTPSVPSGRAFQSIKAPAVYSTEDTIGVNLTLIQR